QRGQHQVPGVGRLSDNLGDLGIADLADHDDVGILAEERPQDLRKRVAGLAVHRNLGDAGHHPLDRVLDADDVGLPGAEVAKGGVEGGRLARAGWAGHEYQAVGAGERLAQAYRGLRIVAQLIERLQRALAVDDPHHDFLAVDGRQRRQPDVDRPFVDAHPERAVLRTEADRDVGLRHDLEAVADRVRGGRRQRHGRLEDAADPEADARALARAVDVDVARPD